MFIMKFLNSNKTRERIAGVLIGLVLSALCVTPALAVGPDFILLASKFSKVVSYVFSIFGILLLLPSFLFFLIKPSKKEECWMVMSIAIAFFCIGITGVFIANSLLDI